MDKTTATSQVHTTCTNPISSTTRGTDEISHSSRASQILVSARSVEEARRLSGLGLGILDLKEPLAGPLGPTNSEIWSECCSEIETASRWSVALGDGLPSMDAAGSVPPGIHFAKAGPAGISQQADLIALWEQIAARLPESTNQVAVAYADAGNAECLAIDKIIESAVEFGLQFLLIDTFRKDGISSTQHIAEKSLRSLVQEAHQGGMQVVLAGSMKITHLRDFVASNADFLGVRGCVCSGTRTAQLSSRKVHELVQALDSYTNAVTTD